MKFSLNKTSFIYSFYFCFRASSPGPGMEEWSPRKKPAIFHGFPNFYSSLPGLAPTEIAPKTVKKLNHKNFMQRKGDRRRVFAKKTRQDNKVTNCEWAKTEKFAIFPSSFEWRLLLPSFSSFCRNTTKFCRPTEGLDFMTKEPRRSTSDLGVKSVLSNVKRRRSSDFCAKTAQ